MRDDIQERSYERARVKIRKRSATIGSSFHPKLEKGLLRMPAPDGCEISLGFTLSWKRSQTLSSISTARPTATWKNEPKVTTQVPSLLMYARASLVMHSAHPSASVLETSPMLYSSMKYDHCCTSL